MECWDIIGYNQPSGIQRWIGCGDTNSEWWDNWQVTEYHPEITGLVWIYIFLLPGQKKGVFNIIWIGYLVCIFLSQYGDTIWNGVLTQSGGLNPQNYERFMGYMGLSQNQGYPTSWPSNMENMNEHDAKPWNGVGFRILSQVQMYCLFQVYLGWCSTVDSYFSSQCSYYLCDAAVGQIKC